MRTLKLFVVVGMMFALAMIVGCGGGGGSSTPTTTTPTVGISIDPAVAVVGGPSFYMTITGTGLTFGTSSVVKIDGQLRSATISSPTQLKVYITANDIAVIGKKVISVAGTTATAELTVKEVPWRTVKNGDVRCIAKDGDMIYSAYSINGDVFMSRFDANGDKVPIADKVDVSITTNSAQERPVGVSIFNSSAYVVVSRDYTTISEGYLVKVNLATGERTESVIMIAGFLTGFATDGAGTTYVAFTCLNQSGGSKYVVRGVNTNASVVYEKAFTGVERITSVAADSSAIYLGGVITNATGEFARMYSRKEKIATGELIWEAQVGATTASANEDMMYPGSFVLDKTNDALYFAGAMDFNTMTPKGAIFRVKASSPTGTFDWGYSVPNSMEYGFERLTVDNGDLYGYNAWTNAMVRMNPANPSILFWSYTNVGYPIAVYAKDSVLYYDEYPSGMIIRREKEGGAVIN